MALGQVCYVQGTIESTENMHEPSFSETFPALLLKLFQRQSYLQSYWVLSSGSLDDIHVLCKDCFIQDLQEWSKLILIILRERWENNVSWRLTVTN